MIQGKGSRRVSLSVLRFPYVKKQKENIESSKNNPSKRRCFERKMKYAAASWPSIIETQLYSFSAILVFHPIFLKYRSRDCSVTGCRNDVQKRAPFLSLSLSRPRFFHDPRFSGIVGSLFTSCSPLRR